MRKETNFTSIHICIPAFKEANITPTLDSLEACSRENLDISISVLVNESLDCDLEVSKINEQTIEDIENFNDTNHLQIQYDYVKFPIKHAGVGLARKTLMDNACSVFLEKEDNGLIVALDADTIVQPNYLNEISSYFAHSKMVAASIFYEHPLDSIEIIEYEYHLRYYNSMQFHSGFPFAIHTVGSAMVCSALSYRKKGGMNKRKAGEDFYFMQKFIKDRVCGNITGTTIIPSSRQSDRVPFGTGRAVLKYEDADYKATTYNPLSFKLLHKLNEKIQNSYGEYDDKWTENEVLNDFLAHIKFNENIEICLKNTKDKESFLKRYYQFFDGFTLMKCLHHMRIEFPDIVIDQAAKFYSESFLNIPFTTVRESLIEIRKEEKARFNAMQP